MGCFVPPFVMGCGGGGGGGGGGGQSTGAPLGAVACCSCFLLTDALLMTSSHSEGNLRWLRRTRLNHPPKFCPSYWKQGILRLCWPVRVAVAKAAGRTWVERVCRLQRLARGYFAFFTSYHCTRSNAFGLWRLPRLPSTQGAGCTCGHAICRHACRQHRRSWQWG